MKEQIDLQKEHLCCLVKSSFRCFASHLFLLRMYKVRMIPYVITIIFNRSLFYGHHCCVYCGISGMRSALEQTELHCWHIHEFDRSSTGPNYLHKIPPTRIECISHGSCVLRLSSPCLGRGPLLDTMSSALRLPLLLLLVTTEFAVVVLAYLNFAFVTITTYTAC